MKHFVFAIVGLIAAAVGPAQAQRLPDTVIPEHYTLWFAPDLRQETFRGRATIEAVVTEPTTTVTLNAAEIAFGEVRITAGGRTQTAQVALDAARERATLTVPQPLAEGPVTIDIAYTGILNDKLRGFYISEANGRKYAVTQMEPTDARRAFPSFDEPAFKATFDVSMTVPAGDTAISNGRAVSETPGPEPGTRTVTFARTPKMSTYLVAMLVGDFVCNEGESDGTVIRICATPDKQHLTQFALEAAEHQLAFYNDYFGIPYPFGKLDIIAVPDFAAGAMENAGAITFRERLLLVEPERSSVGVRKNVARVISHEIAHQWFGNLVTMKWWDDIWLNEGFATWMANKPLAEWRPEWDVHLDDAEGTVGALGVDALRATRSIRTKVETSEEINQVFDAIAYQKTAAVLRMIEAYVGPDAFREAVASYLKRYAYTNAAGEDFWTEVARVTGRPVDRIMRSYVDQPGAPVLAVRQACTAGTSEIAVTQQRFFGDPAAPAVAQTWTVPACFSSGSGDRCTVLDQPAQTTRVEGCSPLFANADARGYYFTEYAPDAARALAGRTGDLAPVERLSLIGDEWWMVRSGRHDIDVFLDLAGALAGDASTAVIDALADRLVFTDEYIVDPAQRPRFHAWVREQFGPALRALGLPGAAGDSDDLQTRRAILLRLVGVTGDDREVQQRARELALGYIEDPGSLPPSLAPTVLQVAALSGDRALFDRYVAQLGTLAAQPEEYYRFFNALSWFRDPTLVERALALARSDAVRTQDTGTLIGGLLGRPWAREAAWAFTQAEWSALTGRLGTFQGIPAIVTALGGMCAPERAREVRAFFEANPTPAASRPLRQAIERIESCAAVNQRQSAPFAAWLAAR